jgi:hypothetical protein
VVVVGKSVGMGKQRHSERDRHTSMHARGDRGGGKDSRAETSALHTCQKTEFSEDAGEGSSKAF